MSKEGFVNIHGKEYKTVAKRVQEFREQYKDYAIITDIVKIDEEQCIMRASIYKVNEDGNGVTLATGHGCEFKSSSQINRTSYVENCETSAIGRALACLGLGGTEFASADEVANAIHQQKTVHAPTQSITPTAGALDNFNAAEKELIAQFAEDVTDLVKSGDVATAASNMGTLESEEKLAVWALLDSKTRSTLKAFKEKK
jgi:hypothetical protein